MQVFLITAISYVRYDILKNQKNEKSISNKIIINSVIISLSLSLFWSGAPILGWSYYSLEIGLVSCSVEYNEKSLNVISYNIGMFIFVFLLPFGITTYTNIKSILIVYVFYIFILNLLEFASRKIRTLNSYF